MVYMLREQVTDDTDCDWGYYVTVHAHEEQGEVWSTDLYPTEEEAIAACDALRGGTAIWENPQEDWSPDILRYTRG